MIDRPARRDQARQSCCRGNRQEPIHHSSGDPRDAAEVPRHTLGKGINNLNQISLWIFAFRLPLQRSIDCGGRSENQMSSDFSAARLDLERAYHHMLGNDETSRRVCEALDLLIEAVATAECQRPETNVVPFRRGRA